MQKRFSNVNRFRVGPYAQPSKPFQFRLRIRGDIRNRKSTPRPFPTSVIRGDADSPYRWYGELANELVKENSLYRWYGELSTPRIGVTVRQRLPILVKWGSTTFRIAESGVGKSLVDILKSLCALSNKNRQHVQNGIVILLISCLEEMFSSYNSIRKILIYIYWILYIKLFM